MAPPFGGASHQREAEGFYDDQSDSIPATLTGNTSRSERYIERMVSEQEGQQGDQQGAAGAAGGHEVGEQRGKAQGKQQHRRAKRRRRWRPKLPAKWREPISILTLVLVILTGVYVYFTGKLLEKTAAAVDLTRQSVEASQAALGEAKRANDFAEQAMADAEEQARADRELTRRSVKATEGALEVAERSAESAERALRITERGRLQGGSAAFAAFAADKPMAMRLVFANEGRMTLRITSILLKAWIAPEGTPNRALPPPKQGKATRQSIPVGPNRSRVHFHYFDLSPSAELVAKYEEGQLRILIAGEATYSDDLGGPYRLPICMETWSESDLEIGASDGTTFKDCSAETEDAIADLFGRNT